MATDDTDEEEFARIEMVKRRAATLSRQEALEDGERDRLRELHWMRCAKCGCELAEVVFRRVKIDKCFYCGGVYLDDGELEQLAGRGGFFAALKSFFG
jgi:hypothetical protein